MKTIREIIFLRKLTLAFCLLAPTLAYSIPVTYQLTGSVTTISDSGGIFDTTQLSYVGSFTYDAAISHGNGTSHIATAYAAATAGGVWSTSITQIRPWSFPAYTDHSISYDDEAVPGPIEAERLNFTLNFLPGTFSVPPGQGSVYSGEAWQLDRFIGGTFFMIHYYPDFTTGFVKGTIDHVSAVPVPAATWLFGSGLLGLANAARRKYRSA